MFEPHHKPLISSKQYYKRVGKNFLWALLIIVFSLGLGMVGYHYLAALSWIDSLLNASMILTGMGPVNPMPNDLSKFFASFYAIYSGVAFLSTIAVFFAPIVHRLMHRFHFSEEE
jgi:hypothetical protein